MIGTDGHLNIMIKYILNDKHIKILDIACMYNTSVHKYTVAIEFE